MKLNNMLSQLTETAPRNITLPGHYIISELPKDLPTHADSVYFHNQILTSLKGCPTKVDGDFKCFSNRLTSLEYGPTFVGGVYDCTDNLLTTLKFSPKHIHKDFSCSHNSLENLDYCPMEVNGSFICHTNELTSLHDIHKHLRRIGGSFSCYLHTNTKVTHILGLMLIDIGSTIVTEFGDETDVDRILNKWKNQGRRGVLGAQRELLDLGYDEMAKL
jgi:hypothetical protein